MYEFKRRQKLATTREELWDFISSPRNLGKITPKEMDFRILNDDLPDKIYDGLIIRYKVKALPLWRTGWVTEITHVKEGSYFVDEQKVGPYALWHHQHFIFDDPEGEGVIMEDIVNYNPPFGFIGSIANVLFLRNKLKQIFDFRTVELDKIFNS